MDGLPRAHRNVVVATQHSWRARTGQALLPLCLCICATLTLGAQPTPPELNAPVNDFANVIDSDSAATLERTILALQHATGDVVVVATIETFAPYGDIREYAVKMFENHGRGIGQAGKDNGLLVLLAVEDRRVWVEVGYGLEGFITDGFAGETSRQYMTPAFRDGAYGRGLVAGVQRIAGRIAQGRNVTLEGVPAYEDRSADWNVPWWVFILVALIIVRVIVASARRQRLRRGGHWSDSSWSGWSSGVGSFGGGSSGGFGGGFGGFSGGRSGGGGGGAGW